MRRAVRAGIVAIVAAGLLAVLAWAVTPPVSVRSFDAVRAGWRPSDVRLLDRHGEILHELRLNPTRRRLAWTPLTEVSPALQAAVIASEDRRFYRHGGVDARALAAAAVRWITGGPPRGGSTISMQVAALEDRSLRRHGGPRTLAQKWRQSRLAWELEARWSKAEILEAYLNLVTFRGELQGVAAAAGALFGKAPHGLTQAEGVTLAALLRAPNAEERPLVRRAAALAAALGLDADDGLPVTVARALAVPRGIGPRVALAPHVAARLLPSPGVARVPLAPVHSTLDADVQRLTIEALRRQLLAVRAQNVRDGAVLVVDNATGAVLAYVGSSGDLATARHVDGVQARRQAGSALKPFLYGLALDQGLLTPASLLPDTPLEVPVVGGLYRPRNYDEAFRGLIPARLALASSLNVPAVRTLGLVGGEVFVHQLRRLGFGGLTESADFYGPALALGAAEVSLWELTNAYRALANGGVWRSLALQPGNDAESRRVYSAAAAFLVSDILADRESRSATFGLESPLATRFWTAVKTGTSKEMRDNWCVGYSARYTVGVWVGNFTGAPMRDVSGVTGAAPVWRDLMTWLHRDAPSLAPAPPAGVVGTPGAFFLAGTEPAAPAVLATEQPRIVAPVSGTIVALDPDIPRGRQRIVFEAEVHGAALRWVVDGEDRGPAEALLAWEPVSGRHAVLLVDAASQVIDTVRFEVRGAPGLTQAGQ